MAAYADSLSIQKADEGVLLQIQGQPGVKSEFQSSLGYSGSVFSPDNVWIQAQAAFLLRGSAPRAWHLN